MQKQYNRTQRVAEMMQRELACLIQRELKDPRVGMTTVLSVEVTRDFSFAKVYISLLGDDEVKKRALSGLDNASGFLRRELGKRISLRITPKLRFIIDNSSEKGTNLSQLIDKALESDKHLRAVNEKQDQ